MDFFEKAHVTRKQPSEKENKSDGNMKRQLKQMLHGYKNSDNELIKRSADANIDPSDSASVSGFSDLNLTVSDIDADTSSVTIPRERRDNLEDRISRIENTSHYPGNPEKQKNTAEHSYVSTSRNEKQIAQTVVKDTPESLSEDDDEEASSPGVTHFKFSEKYVSSSGDFSLKHTIEVTSTDNSENSDPDCWSTSTESEFDQDGALASKIIERLEENGAVKKKRKVENVSSNAQIVKKQVITNKIQKEIVNLGVNTNLSTDDDDSQDSSERQTSEFISIVTSKMANRSFKDILGNYFHSTIRNLPSNRQNIVCSTNNSGVFATDEMAVEDVSSLVPELGDIETADLELDEEATDMPLDDRSVYDTIQSDSERETADENSVKVFYGNNSSCIFVLKHPARLYVHGKVKIKPLGGTVEVFGYTLKDEVRLYAPNYNYAQCIKTVENINAYYGLFSKLTSAGLTVAEAEEIVTGLGDYDGVISMSPFNDKKIDFVENNFSTADLFTKPSKNTDEYLKKASVKLSCSLYLSKPWRFFEESPIWNEAVSHGLNSNSRGVICGGKGLGKSTFLKYYVNKMLENGPVLVIDLDPGQAEFTVAGSVSATIVTRPLLGPNFTHLQTPEIQLNVGMINVMDNTVRYANAVGELLRKCRANPAFSTIPWIINTMGMTNNMGLKLITLTIIHVQPTFLFQIDTKIAKKRFDCRLQPYNITQLYKEDLKTDRLFRNVECPKGLDYNFMLAQHVEGSDRNNSSMSPKDERYLNYLAYFGELLYMQKGDLLGIVPYEVKLSDLTVVTNVKVAAEAVGKVINGKIVALCQLDTADKGTVFTLDDKPMLCHGHGLVRGVDSEKGTLYVLSPAAGGRLAAADALLYADWAPELTAAEAAAPGTPLPYRTAAVQQHKQLMLSPRRRFNPIQFLKMSRST